MPLFTVFPSAENADRTLCFSVAGKLGGAGAAEAALAWRTRPGELFSSASAAAAGEAAAGARKLGLPSSIFEAGALPALPGPEKLDAAVPAEGGLRVFCAGSPVFLPWNSFAAFAAGAVEDRPLSADPEAALRRAFFPEAAGAPGTEFLLDLLTAAGRRLRLFCGDADYSGLGAGRSLSSLDNFRLLLERLRNFSEGAVPFNAAFAALCGRLPLPGPRLADPAAFDRGLRWFLAVTLNKL